MTTTAKKPAKQPISKKRARKSASTDAELKPFGVVRGKYLFWFTPETVGFSVVCQNIPGVNAQGDTFEEALAHAVSMAEFVEECRAEMAKGGR